MLRNRLSQPIMHCGLKRFFSTKLTWLDGLNEKELIQKIAECKESSAARKKEYEDAESLIEGYQRRLDILQNKYQKERNFENEYDRLCRMYPEAQVQRGEIRPAQLTPQEIEKKLLAEDWADSLRRHQ